MKILFLHAWNLSYTESIDLQRELARKVICSDRLADKIVSVAGVDVSCRFRSRLLHAAVVTFSYPDLQPQETVTASQFVDFPYVPGLLSFRELPVVLEAVKKLQCPPDLFLVDGQGVAHPRGLGLASHLGLWLDLPTIGCAKSRLYGEHGDVGERKGDTTALLDKRGGRIGTLLRSRDAIKPLYVSPGHMVSMETAARLVLSCCQRFRLPEPIRAAHAASNQQRLRYESGASG